MLLGIHPAVRLVIGAGVLVLGVATHRVFFDAAGAAVILLGAGQWLYRARR